jgi:hypothetical protein
MFRIWGSNSGGQEEYGLLGYIATQSIESQLMLQRNILPPSSGSNKLSKASVRKLVASRVPLAFFLVSCSVYPILKMEAICSSEMLVHFQQITWLHIPEDSTLQEYVCCSYFPYSIYCWQHSHISNSYFHLRKTISYTKFIHLSYLSILFFLEHTLYRVLSLTTVTWPVT